MRLRPRRWQSMRLMQELTASTRPTYTIAAVADAFWVAKAYHLNRFVVERTPYHLLDRRVERELVPMAQTYGVGLTIWSPLAGGFLSGKYRRGAPKPAAARFRETGAPTVWTERH